MEPRISFKMDEGEVKEGGSDSGVETNGVAVASCDSSLVSCCSEEALRALEEDEGGSEGSSVSGGKPPRTPRPSHRPARPPVKDRSVSRGPQLSRSVSLRQEPQTKKPTPRSPLDDGRWPSTSAPRVKPRPPEKKVNIMSVSLTADPKEKFATLPRRRRNSLENLVDATPRPGPPAGRDLSLNRAASLRRKKESSTGGLVKQRGRTRIYHEVCVQTAFTGQDIDQIISGNKTHRPDPFTRVEMVDSSVQVDKRIEAVERLESELKHLQEKMAKVSEEKKDFEKCREELKAEKSMRQSLERRLRALLPDKFSDGEVVDSVEKHCNLKNEICLKQQQEIAKLQSMVVTLRRDLEKSFMMHRKFLEQQQEVEAESMEIQEFLQAEKSTLADTLKDLETEVETAKKELLEKEAELQKQQEECSHLVRISEQRRQEKLAVEARLRALESNSRTIMLEQTNSISSASVALTNLGSKLEGLIDALVTSYNISQQDLEEVVFHNEAYSGSGSDSGSPEVDTSPQHKPSQGFLANIFKALWAPSQKSLPVETISDCEMLSAEPEPPAFSLQEGTTASSKRLSIASIASISDISHRASLATSDDLDIPVERSSREGSLANSESLQNLSQAILQRQREEEEINREVLIQPPQNNLVDLVIHVDNQVTKLLNIMHIVHNRKVDSEKGRLSIEAASSVLKEEIVELTEKLNLCSKSSEQVEVLQRALKEKEQELDDLKMKFELTQELLTNNWHKAMSEVKRQYEAIDAALEALNGIGDEIKQSPALSKVQRELEEANFRCATSLPVSSSQPDLNANPTPKTINGKV